MKVKFERTYGKGMIECVCINTVSANEYFRTELHSAGLGDLQ